MSQQPSAPRNAPGLRSRELKVIRAAAGLKQSQLILRLEAAGRELDLPVAPRPSLKRMVSGWENGAPMSADYRRLFGKAYGVTEADLGFVPVQADADTSAGGVRRDDLVERATGLRHDLDSFIGQDETMAAHLDSLDERVDLHARDCVRLAPSMMLQRLLADFEEIKALVSRQASTDKHRLCGIATGYASLIADEMMVLGRPADAQAWHTTAKTAADRAGDATLRARSRSLNALLYLYYGEPSRAVELARYAQTFGGKASPATALAAAVEAFALARDGNADASREALRVGERLFLQQPRNCQADSVFGFSERRWLSTEAARCSVSAARPKPRPPRTRPSAAIRSTWSATPPSSSWTWLSDSPSRATCCRQPISPRQSSGTCSLSTGPGCSSAPAARC